MRRDALTGHPPEPLRVRCCVCGRWTEAPVTIGYSSASGAWSVTHYVCPDHVVGGRCAADHTRRAPDH